MTKLRGNELVSRRAFLKLGLTGLSATALLFLSGCLGEQEEEDDEGGEEDD